MTARLVLLTGPAAGDVYRVFLQGCPLYPAGHPVNEKDGHWWDEVRDYLDAPRQVAVKLTGRLGFPDSLPAEIAEAAGSIPGGEAWLVGLVLPDQQRTYGAIRPVYSQPHWMDVQPETRQQFVANVLGRHGLPARLAILAPEPPPLLVERVRAWGGEVWWCSVDEHEGSWARIDPTPARVARDCLAAARTWPEAVRAALGEVAP